MHLVSLSEFAAAGQSVVTVGNFDGVHRGHAMLMKEVVARARSRGAAALAVTFHPHTRTVVAGAEQSALTTLDEKAVLIEPLGIDYLVWVPFDETYAKMEGMKFAETIIMDRLGAVEWVMGEDHAFGVGRAGNRETLQNVMGRKHFSIFASPPVSGGPAPVTSTDIRARIVAGRLEEAVELLGHPYLIIARREAGRGEARRLGFPTMNFARPSPPKVIPPAGVYAASLVAGEASMNGALYYGECPTLGSRQAHLEFHATSKIEADPAYGTEACVYVRKHIRADRVFASAAELTEQVSRDIQEVNRFFQQE